MRLLSLLLDFDAALDWALDDPLLVDFDPPTDALSHPWTPAPTE